MYRTTVVYRGKLLFNLNSDHHIDAGMAVVHRRITAETEDHLDKRFSQLI